MAAEGDRCVVSEQTIDDLLGDVAPDDAEDAPIEIGQAPDIRQVVRGVTVTWLMDAFRKDRRTVRKRLAELTPLKYGKGNTPIYDFVQACSYLVEPKIDLDKYLQTLKPEQLPLPLQTEYWDVILKRQKALERAGQLWPTDKVIEVFSEVLKHVKDATQLWATTLDRRTGLTPQQYEVLEKLTDKLLDDIHKRLSQMESLRQTPSSLAEIEETHDAV
jgi:hypothetical protein